jgi:hypothetical protein
VPDILSQGREREPGPGQHGPRWRRLALAGLAVAALAGLVVSRLPGHHAPAHHSAHRTSPPLAGAQSGTDANLPAEPAGLTGPTAAWDASLRLPLAGSQPAWFYPASGRREPIGGLPASQIGYAFSRAVGGWAVQAAPPAGTEGQLGCAACASPPLPVWFLADGASRAIWAGRANLVAPGARRGTLWLTSYPPGATAAPGTAKLTATNGRALGPPVRLPGGYVIETGTVRGLLLAPGAGAPLAGTGRPRADLLWNPATGRVTRRLSGVIAASASRVAWQEPCPGGCRLHLLELASGWMTTIPLAPGSTVPAAAFSPDGRFLALQVTSPTAGDSGAAPTRLEVAGPSALRLSPVPGTSVSSDALAGFGWPDGQDRLVAELSFTTKVQVAAWKPGAPRLAVAAVRPGPHLGSVVTG